MEGGISILLCYVCTASSVTTLHQHMQISESARKIHPAPKKTAMRHGKFSFYLVVGKIEAVYTRCQKMKYLGVSTLWMINEGNLAGSHQDPKSQE